MIYFTSDLHIGHEDIINNCKRPFENVYEMNEQLISNFNAVVKNSDTVYILGDLFFGTDLNYVEILSKLNGKKHLIIGNHDRDWMKKCDYRKYFDSVDFMREIKLGSKLVTLCHYPMMTFNKQDSNGVLIYGHIHNNRNDKFFSMLKSMNNVYNCGVDINNYKPVCFNELVKNYDSFINEKAFQQAFLHHQDKNKA